MQQSTRDLAEVRDYMLFPAPITQEEIDRKQKAFAAGFRAMAGGKK